MIEEINQTINGEINEETPKYSAKAQNFETVVDYTTRISNFDFRSVDQKQKQI